MLGSVPYLLSDLGVMMEEDGKRIAVWSGPHAAASQLMRAFESRPDTQVSDEPFRAHYLKATDPVFVDPAARKQILRNQSSDLAVIAVELLAPLDSGKSIFFQKHRSQHLLIGMDQSWMKHLANVFLIQDPMVTLAYFAQSGAPATLADLGLPQQLSLFDLVAAREGEIPPVIDTADLLQNPEKTLRALCGSLDIAFDDAMLSWPKGKRSSDGVWGAWEYQGLEDSRGFVRQKKPTAPLQDHHLEVANLAVSFYERLARHKL
jgi:Sulfotransferase domain